MRARRQDPAYAEEAREALRRSRALNPERTRENSRRSGRHQRQEYPERVAATKRRATARLRAKVFGHYGTSCACCGATKRLTIDHVNGDGAAHRMELFGRRNGGGEAIWRWLVKNGFPDGFQTLCLRCNQSKKTGERCRLDHSTELAA